MSGRCVLVEALKQSTFAVERHHAELIAVWCTRMLNLFGSASRRELAHQQILSRLLGREIDLEGDDFALRWTEDPPAETIVTSVLGEWLDSTLGLNETERQTLVFLALLAESPTMQLLGDELGEVHSRYQVVDTVSRILQLPFVQIRRTLAKNSNLMRLDLVHFEEWDHRGRLSRCIEVNDIVCMDLFSEPGSPLRLREAFAQPLPESELTLGDFRWLGPELDVVVRYLTAVRERQTQGVHILIYGPPGVGKSELARVLAKCCGYQGLAISGNNDEGDALSPLARVAIIRRYQRIYAEQGNSLIVYDEADELFAIPPGRNQQPHKVMINELLESGRLPVIWICNQIDGFDPAVLRRFDLHLALVKPPRQVRQSILQRVAGELEWQTDAITAFERLDDVTPAQIATAAKVVSHLSDESRPDLCAVGLIERTLSRHGHTPSRKLERSRMDRYAMELVNADLSVTELLNGLQRESSARLLFHGAPGTGKSALARHFSERLERPLIARSSADLLGSFVGQTESQIADAFRVAERDGAILLLDEIDSFLPDRGGTHRQHERAMVNEMLIQMERFNGLLIGTTNRPEQLDAAVLRRFDFKIEFRALTPTQLEQLLHACCKDLQITNDMRSVEMTEAFRNLSSLPAVVPGNFATAKRRLRLLGNAPTLAALINAVSLEARSAYTTTNRPIGFTVGLDRS